MFTKEKYKNVQRSTINNIPIKCPSRVEWINCDLFIKWSNHTATRMKELHAVVESHKQNVEGK